VLVSAFGPPKRRFVIGAFEIDTAAWGSVPSDNKKGTKWRVPLLDRTNLDASELRGRRLQDVRFGLGASINYRSIDGSGTVRHPSTR
jgi:hypothetical protein